MIVDSLLAQIENGRAGHSQGISMGLPKLEGIIDGVTRQTYSIVFGQSSTGKKYIFLTLLVKAKIP